MNRINWPRLMTAGLRGLGLRPAEFWALTPAELMLMLGVGGGNAPLTRDRLDQLIAAFPDDGTGPDLTGTDQGKG
ncbi:phage tail assembly chaperone [Marinovum sp. 2_MG-2023]|uniref:rcc01693 family protein n=1 Tax=unclassified Marinovum TaxID=2647166 RepID=UPI0026E2801F|nr:MULTISPECIES: rcc01693 family protein [unclassified Marinovum]MDO6731016.1 phage tail assembly chaperone [Marinovum sp. 2_MG-2023]MDO6778513.1 phage tail assembly chaperone [Marinovum sp. 1_MG-2023]